MVKKIFIFLLLIGFVYDEKAVSEDQIKKNHSRHRYVEKLVKNNFQIDYKIENGWLWYNQEGIPIRIIERIKIEGKVVTLWKCNYNNRDWEIPQMYYLLMTLVFKNYEEVKVFIKELTSNKVYNVETESFGGK